MAITPITTLLSNVHFHVAKLPIIPRLIIGYFPFVVLQTILGVLFDKEVEALTESVNDPDDPHAVAQACFTAAIVYGCFLAFCGCQVRTAQSVGLFTDRHIY